MPEWILDAEISDRALRLYGILARYADEDGRCTPARSTIAKRLRCSTDSVDRAKAELMDLGALEVKRRTDDAGDPTSNEYLLRVVPLEGSRTAAATPPQGSGHGSRTAAAQNENQLNETTPLPQKAASEPEKAPKKPRKPDPLWDTLVAAGLTAPTTSSERGRWNKALKEIRSAGATAETLAGKIAEYRRRWSTIEMTPTAIAANWSLLTAAPARKPADQGAPLETCRHGVLLKAACEECRADGTDERCEDCGGRGFVPRDSGYNERCETCGGSGRRPPGQVLEMRRGA